MPHVHEKIDITAEVFVVFNNRVLLRKHDKYGIWLSVGGHIELDEDPNQAALREVKEEVGLDVKLIDTRKLKRESKDYKELIPPVGLNRHRISDTHEHVTMIFFATSTTNEVIPEKETDVWRWYAEDEIDALENCPENVKHFAKRALGKS